MLFSFIPDELDGRKGNRTFLFVEILDFAPGVKLNDFNDVGLKFPSDEYKVIRVSDWVDNDESLTGSEGY